jgi:hypothetical protein
MTVSVRDRPEDITAGWITEVMSRRVALGGARISEIAVTQPREMQFHAAVTRIALTWTPGAPPDVPVHLIVKQTKDPAAPEPRYPAGLGEPVFYRDIAPLVAGLPLPRCYDVACDEATGRFHLILDKSAETHRQATEWPIAPSFEECKRIVATFAQVHAAWWDDPRLGIEVGRFIDPDSQVARSAKALSAFADRLGDRLPAEWLRRLERVLAATPRLLRRYRTGRNATLIHGDAHAWTILFPKEGIAGGLRLVEWHNFAAPATGAYDLARFMAIYWYPERRRRYEADLLAHYHGALEAGGVRGYTLDALKHDYRHSVIQNLLRPVSLLDAVHASVWWDHLERIMLAYEDLDCEALLDQLTA